MRITSNLAEERLAAPGGGQDEFGVCIEGYQAAREASWYPAECGFGYTLALTAEPELGARPD